MRGDSRPARRGPSESARFRSCLMGPRSEQNWTRGDRAQRQLPDRAEQATCVWGRPEIGLKASNGLFANRLDPNPLIVVVDHDLTHAAHAKKRDEILCSGYSHVRRQLQPSFCERPNEGLSCPLSVAIAAGEIGRDLGEFFTAESIEISVKEPAAKDRQQSVSDCPQNHEE